MKNENKNNISLKEESFAKIKEVENKRREKQNIKKKEMFALSKNGKKNSQDGLFVFSNTDRSVCDVVLANIIVLSAVFLVAFIPIVSFALPLLLFIYLMIGLWGFVYNKEMGKDCKYEDLFVSMKYYIKIFCAAIIKIFLVAFWSLFLIVPGVICMLNYCFVGVILYECPDLDVRGALMLSKELVKGFRWSICFWCLLSIASVCAALTLMFFVIMFFDIFFFVPSTIYIIFVLLAGVLDFVLMAMPMVELSIVDYYIVAKSKKTDKIG